MKIFSSMNEVANQILASNKPKGIGFSLDTKSDIMNSLKKELASIINVTKVAKLMMGGQIYFDGSDSVDGSIIKSKCLNTIKDYASKLKLTDIDIPATMGQVKVDLNESKTGSGIIHVSLPSFSIVEEKKWKPSVSPKFKNGSIVVLYTNPKSRDKTSVMEYLQKNLHRALGVSIDKVSVDEEVHTEKGLTVAYISSEIDNLSRIASIKDYTGAFTGYIYKA